ncbi:IS21 family transposase, partial [Bifidobacterium minimum]|uniref:IS21 family transposase n=1 Tax=Bifidobacterium minimum TaxID=1693 RepID=UPI001EE6BC57
PKLDAFRPVVDGWLAADRFMPGKQRHTAKRVFDRLVTEHGFDGSYSVVQRYVKRWRQEHRLGSDGFMELAWHPGEAQVDFGVAQAVIGGDRVGVHCLVVSFPFSNMRYVVALPGENAACVCYGLRLVFEHIGVVPMMLVFDNATGAGHRVAWDKVTIVKLFALFLAHYRLETRFCNPYSGNEKGSVENAVGFLRRNIMVPILNAESYGQLTRFLLERCDALANNGHYRKGTSIASLFEREKEDMQPLPRIGFDAVDWRRNAGRTGTGGSRWTATITSRVLPGAGGAWRWDCVPSTSNCVPRMVGSAPSCPGSMVPRRSRSGIRRFCCPHWEGRRMVGPSPRSATISPPSCAWRSTTWMPGIVATRSG